MKILIADDEKNIRETLRKLLELEGMQADCAADGEEARSLLASHKFDLAVLDLKMPKLSGQELLEWLGREGLLLPVVIISAHGEIADAVKALKTGAKDFLEKPFEPEELIGVIRRCVADENRLRTSEAARRTAKAAPRLIGEHASIRAIRELIARIADTDSTVLICGESGTGKEIVAREIHARSRQAEAPFVAVNVGGMPEPLVESELFGHEKGAFTSADSRRTGLFELAGSGTLFLDEIGDMPPAVQVKLLRVLQEKKIRRLGGTRDIPVDARIISATNCDLTERIRSGAFREDLYYRLNVIRIEVPPLRERLEDLPLLSRALLAGMTDRLGGRVQGITDEALETLRGHAFPGNVRELENVLERACIYSAGGAIRARELDLQTASGVPAARAPARGLDRETLAAELARWNGNRTKAARALGVSRRTILYKINKFGLGG